MSIVFLVLLVVFKVEWSGQKWDSMKIFIENIGVKPKKENQK